jgi:urease subunit beta
VSESGAVSGSVAGAGREPGLVPGELRFAEGAVQLFDDSQVIRLMVENTGDRAVQVGSHYHFAQANPALRFDRAQALGYRLAIPAGTSVRFEPGIEREVALVPLKGQRSVPGLRRDLPGLVDGRAREPQGRLDAPMEEGHG